MSEQSTFDLEKPPSSPSTNSLRLLSLFLLLPAILLCSASQVYPAVDTFLTSRTDSNLLQDSENIGFENYDRLGEDDFIGETLGFTLRLTVARVLIIATVPLLIGLLVGVQPRLPRLANRMCLSLVVVTLSPVILGILWFHFLGRTWDFDTFEPAPFDPLPDSLMLASRTGARNNLQLLDALIALGAAVGVGSLAFMAVARGRELSKEPVLAGLAAWILGVLFAITSFTQGFDLPFLLTGGGPARSTTTLPLYSYDIGFRRFDFGYVSALASIEIVVVMILAALIWAVITIFNLRLRVVPAEDKSPGSPTLSLLSAPLILLLGFPLVGLMIWGLWLVLSNGGFSPAFDMLDWNQVFINSLQGPLFAIWVIQLPLAYLVGLTLGFFRPLGRIGSSVLFLPLLVFAMLPLSAMTFAWFDIAREQELLNEPFPVLAIPWLFGGVSLIVLKMFFDGAHDTYHEAIAAGESNGEAFANHVIVPSLPLVLAVGAGLSLLASGELLWALTVINDMDLSTATVNLIRIHTARAGTGIVEAGSAVFYAGIISIIFVPIVAVLHIFVDRLALVAGELRSPDEPVQVVASHADDAPTETITEDVDEIEENGSLPVN